MSTMALSTPPRRLAVSVRRTRRTTRFALACESLESRQLLSVGNTGLVSAAVPALSAAQAQFAAPPFFPVLAPAGSRRDSSERLPPRTRVRSLSLSSSGLSQSPLTVARFSTDNFDWAGRQRVWNLAL